MSNLVFGFPQSGANDNSEGAVAWTNPSYARFSDEDSQPIHASADLTALNTTTQLLKMTDFYWYTGDVPAGATILGVIVYVEGYEPGGYGDVAYQTVKLVKSGSVVGTNQAGSTLLGKPESNQRRKETMFGEKNSLWGTTLTPSDINDPNFGVAISFNGSGNVRTARVSSVRMVVYWQGASVQCVATAISPTTGKMAPYAFHAHAIASEWGTAEPEDVAVKWEVTEYPVGWAQTCIDPRPGNTVVNQVRDCSTDIVGWNSAWLFTLPGTYRIKARMITNHPTTNAAVTTESNELVVVVDSNTRTKRYLNYTSGNDSNDGLTSGAAWKTWERAIEGANGANAVGSNVELIIQDDTIEAPVTFAEIDCDQLWVRRSGDGTNKPILRLNATGFHFDVGSISPVSDIVIDGIRFDYDAAVAVGDYNALINSGVRWTRLTFNEVESEAASFLECTTAHHSQEALILNCTVTGIRRYGIYLGGNIHRYTTVLGTYFENTSAMAGEGLIRIDVNTGQSTDTYGDGNGLGYGIGATLAWCNLVNTVSSEKKGGFRCHQAYQSIYQCKAFEVSIPLGQGVYSGLRDMDFVTRMDGIWADNCVFTQDGLSKHRKFINSRLPWGVSLGTGGVSYQLSFANCWFTTDFTYAGHQGIGIINNYPTIKGLAMHGNVFTMIDSPVVSQQMLYWLEPSLSPIDVIWKENLIPAVKADPLRTQNAFQMENVGYNVSTWNATAYGEGNVEALDIEQGDIVGTTDYIVPVAFSPDIVTSNSIKGVFWDYRGISRDFNTALWYAGMTGNEVGGAPAAPNISYTTPVELTKDVVASLSPTNTGGPVSSWSVVSGSLPTGLTLNSSTGVISGTPTTLSSGTFTIRATNATGNDDFVVTFDVVEGLALPNISFITPWSLTLGQSVSRSPTNSGGTSTNWTVQSGAIPSGLSLNGTSGQITGTTTLEESGSFILRATNATGYDEATVNFTVTNNVAIRQSIIIIAGNIILPIRLQ